MKPYLTIQFGSFVEDASVLELLSYPEGVFDDPDPGCRIEIWSGGKRYTRRRKRGSDAISVLSEDRFNEAFLRYGKQTWPERKTEFKLLKRIAIPPRHPLWMPPFIHDSKDLSRDERNARATHQSFHDSVSLNDIRPYPTMVQVELRIEKNWEYWEEDEAFASLVDFAWRGLSSRVTELCSFGALSFDPVGWLITENLAPWPQSIPLLDRRFGDLHPILFGDESLCLGLRDALTPHLGHAPEIRRKGSLTMLVVGREVEGLAEHEEVKRFLVPREGKPGTNKRIADESLGEYSFLSEEGYISYYIEKTRFIELFGPEALAYQGDGVLYWETIDRQVCDEAGVTPAGNLVAFAISDTILEAQRKTRLRFKELDPSLPPAERVWRAHEDVYQEMGEHLLGAEDIAGVIELIRRYFFEGGPKSVNETTKE